MSEIRPATYSGQSLWREFFDRPALDVAPEVIGAGFFHSGVGGRIVEVEAYDMTDPASHSFRGPTLRNAAMFGPPGHAYVYRIYGIHFCVNFVCQRGSAVLIRALEPTDGLDVMAERRGAVGARQLCSGPGKLAQAMGIDLAQNGQALDAPPFSVLAADDQHPVATGQRIGITKGVDLPWRFVLEGSPFLSRPMR